MTLQSKEKLTNQQKRVISLIMQIAIDDKPNLAKSVKQETWRFLNNGF